MFCSARPRVAQIGVAIGRLGAVGLALAPNALVGAPAAADEAGQAEEASPVAQPLGRGIESEGYLWNSREVEALELIGDLDDGARIFRQGCSECHDADGAGKKNGTVPKVAGQHFAYLYSQIRDMALERRRNSLPAMVEVISKYSAEELMAVTDHLSRMEWPKAGPAEDLQY